MSVKNIIVVGYAKQSKQFVVKAQNFDVRISKNDQFPDLEGPSPIEYILAGYAGCINAIGTLVASELNLNLKSLQVEVKGKINVDKFLGKETKERAGFKSIEVVINPETDASPDELKKWLAILENRCPVGDNLKYETPVYLSLEPKYDNAVVQ